MFCNNCGNEITDNVDVCPNCGTPCGAANTQNATFCSNCGKEVDPNAAVCTSCGHAIKKNAPASSQDPNAKSKMAAGLFGILLGCFGVHNFYLGYTGKAITQLSITVGSIVLSIITCGLFAVVAPFTILGASVWGLIEGIMILTGSITTDAQGNPLKD